MVVLTIKILFLLFALGACSQDDGQTCLGIEGQGGTRLIGNCRSDCGNDPSLNDTQSKFPCNAGLTCCDDFGSAEICTANITSDPSEGNIFAACNSACNSGTTPTIPLAGEDCIGGQDLICCVNGGVGDPCTNSNEEAGYCQVQVLQDFCRSGLIPYESTNSTGCTSGFVCCAPPPPPPTTTAAPTTTTAIPDNPRKCFPVRKHNHVEPYGHSGAHAHSSTKAHVSAHAHSRAKAHGGAHAYKKGHAFAKAHAQAKAFAFSG